MVAIFFLLLCSSWALATSHILHEIISLLVHLKFLTKTCIFMLQVLGPMVCRNSFGFNDD